MYFPFSNRIIVKGINIAINIAIIEGKILFRKSLYLEIPKLITTFDFDLLLKKSNCTKAELIPNMRSIGYTTKSPTEMPINKSL
jgi:hypothetical protein